jgi:hypothetical protein
MTARKVVESDEYFGFVSRAIRAYGRRVGDGDLLALADLVKVRDLVDQAIVDGAQQAHGAPYRFSWTEIGSAMGTSRQAARQLVLRRTEATTARCQGIADQAAP